METGGTRRQASQLAEPDWGSLGQKETLLRDTRWATPEEQGCQRTPAAPSDDVTGGLGKVRSYVHVPSSYRKKSVG